MFGKKKNNNIIRVMHYEGLDNFIQDYPCTIEMKDDVFEIKRIKPETTVTLPKNQIIKFEAIEEERFMLKYHNNAVRTDKGIKKFYLVVTYISKSNEEKYIAFWGTAFEYGNFIDLQKNYENNQESNSYSL